jgi:DNA-binding SARP family transcriptional activator
LTRGAGSRRGDGHARVEVLHQFRLLVEGDDVPLSDGSERLVGCLAVAGRPSTRSGLAGALWPDRTERDAQASLRRALWRLNRDAPGLLAPDTSHIGLSDHVEVDLHELYLATESVPDGDPASDPALIRMLEGDLLPHWSYDWLDGRRESLRQLRLHTLETLARTDLEAGRTTIALMTALAAVNLDPLRESAQRIVIAVHLAEGNMAEAIRQYVAFRDLLWNELHLRPGHQLRSMLPGSDRRRTPQAAPRASASSGSRAARV